MNVVFYNYSCSEIKAIDCLGGCVCVLFLFVCLHAQTHIRNCKQLKQKNFIRERQVQK